MSAPVKDSEALNSPKLRTKAKGAPVSRSALLCCGRKPNSVPLHLLKAQRRWSFISRRDFSPPRGVSRHACDRYPRRAPEFPPRPGRRPGVSVWPCTAWGLSCPGSCLPGGGLLPRLFTLTTAPVRARHGGLFSVTLSIVRGFRPDPPRTFPRHAAFWCSDFPLPRTSRSDHLPTGKIADLMIRPKLKTAARLSERYREIGR
jgi:hypothetical protein